MLQVNNDLRYDTLYTVKTVLQDFYVLPFFFHMSSKEFSSIVNNTYLGTYLGYLGTVYCKK